VKKSTEGALPNMIIIGAAKCATTSLHYYLGLHPQIAMSRDKEINFFNVERNWAEGVEWYRSKFQGKATVRGESSVGYTFYPFARGVPERMHSVVPEAKLIYILRDPMDRIISDYVHCYADSRRGEDRTIADALSHLDHNPYVCRSKYYMQLEQYLKYFSMSNILIVTQEDLFHQRRVTLQKIFAFLNVDEDFYSTKFFNVKHKTIEKRRKNRIGLFLQKLAETNMAKIISADARRDIGRIVYLPFSNRMDRPVLSEHLRKELIDYLQDDVSRLRRYTGLDFDGWCV